MLKQGGLLKHEFKVRVQGISQLTPTLQEAASAPCTRCQQHAHLHMQTQPHPLPALATSHIIPRRIGAVPRHPSSGWQAAARPGGRQLPDSFLPMGPVRTWMKATSLSTIPRTSWGTSPMASAAAVPCWACSGCSAGDLTVAEWGPAAAAAAVAGEKDWADAAAGTGCGAGRGTGMGRTACSCWGSKPGMAAAGA